MKTQHRTTDQTEDEQKPAAPSTVATVSPALTGQQGYAWRLAHPPVKVAPTVAADDVATSALRRARSLKRIAAAYRQRGCWTLASHNYDKAATAFEAAGNENEAEKCRALAAESLEAPTDKEKSEAPTANDANDADNGEAAFGSDLIGQRAYAFKMVHRAGRQ